MAWIEALRDRLKRPQVLRWGLASLVVAILHLGIFALLPNPDLKAVSAPDDLAAAPIYLQITPRARPPAPERQARARSVGSPLPPVAIRAARVDREPSDVAPLVVDTPPPNVRPRAPGRVIPRSWRERCGLGDGEVSEGVYQACRDLFLNAASPGSSRARGSGDPSQDFAAQGAARIAAYEYRRAPAPTGSGNAAPSATPGSNFGMGEIDRSVIYVQGERPRVNE